MSYVRTVPESRMYAGFILQQQFRLPPSFIKRITRNICSAHASYRQRLYRCQDYVENLEFYRSGGHHPVLLNDVYHQGRYQVVHKLGYGSFSTVWLARDCIADRYVSLKILTAESSKYSQEAQILKHVSGGDTRRLGHNFISPLLDEFVISGPNGHHKCLVGHALGPTVSTVQLGFSYDLLPLGIAKRITFQLAQGLAYVHSRGVIHGGQS